MLISCSHYLINKSNNITYFGPSGHTGTFGSSGHTGTNFGPSGHTGTFGSSGTGTNIILDEKKSYNLSQNNMFTKKINLSKEICQYLNIKNNCSISELKNGLEIISIKNKELLNKNNFFNKENISNKKSVIFLDNEGKKIFDLKSNLIDINCLIDLIMHNFVDKIPNSFFYDHNKIPKEITELIL